MIEDTKTLIEDKKVAKELINDLARDITEYGNDYEIIDNPQLEWYDENDADYLRFPYAVKFTIEYSEYYLGKPYSEILYINETFDGLEYEYEDYTIPVENPEWFFLGYSQKLIDKLKYTKEINEKLEKELSSLKSEYEYKIRKLEDRLIERNAI